MVNSWTGISHIRTRDLEAVEADLLETLGHESTTLVLRTLRDEPIFGRPVGLHRLRFNIGNMLMVPPGLITLGTQLRSTFIQSLVPCKDERHTLLEFLMA